MKNIREIVKEKILILDGAMGTEIQKYNCLLYKYDAADD